MAINKNLNKPRKNTKNEVKGVPINFQSDETYSPLFLSTIRLFNAVPIKTDKKKRVTKQILEKTINNGFILAPQVLANYNEDQLKDIIELASHEVGLSPQQMNASFHKSWKKVKEAPIFQLVVEQVFHYITTYGYERLGIYNKNSVFFPSEDLKIPKLKDGIKLAVIKGYTKKELKQKLLKLLESGVALNTIEELVDVATFVELQTKDITKIKNKEVRVRMYEKMNILPELPIEFLRFIMYKTTGSTLIIKNKETIDLIKESTTDVTSLFKQYDKHFGYKRLAEIFLRFKPLFLALRVNELTSIINKISHLSKKYHKPLAPSLLNDVTGLLKNNQKINEKQLKTELESANIFRKIRLLSALHYRLNGTSSMLYKIRNGKGYAKESEFDNDFEARNIYDIIYNSILKSLKHLKGKKIHIPENIKYALPATAKQFTGNIPSGSYVTVKHDMIFGVYWEDVKGNRIDLDLSTISLWHGKVGWDARYRSDDRAILFSGDVTAAPKGASELFWVSKAKDDQLLLCVNYFNYRKNIPVPFKIIVAKERPTNFEHNYMVNPNNVQCIAKTEINIKQKVLGLAKIENGECRFYFSETGLGKSITSSSSKFSDTARDYLANYTTNMITLNDVLEKVGAKILIKPQKSAIDLSPELVEKDTIINLLTNQ